MPLSTVPARSLALCGALAALLALSAPGASAQGTTLAGPEQQLKQYIEQHREEQIDFLARAVNISSGTMNQAGVRAVGQLFRTALDSLGFDTRWIAMPDAVHRAGHLVAEHKGSGGKRILLIGHFDTVFEGEGEQFVREDTLARGAGSSDMKGGDVAILYALRALNSIGALKDATITAVFTGDEESAGDPLSISRKDLIDAARHSDIALAFEGGSRGEATVARRGASTWVLRTTGRQAHSAGMFDSSTGYGAIYEAARILNSFRDSLAGQQYLTFSPGIIVGGTDVTFDSAHFSGTAAGKSNIVPHITIVPGDLRFLSQGQLDSARATMRRIVSRSLPGTSAEISFQDEYPAMSPTPANYVLLAQFDSVSQALGYGSVEALDPGRRGAGDISFIAPLIPGLDGLGVSGSGAHTPDERVNLNSLPMATERAAVLIYRLTR